MVQRKDIRTEDIVSLYQSGMIGREVAQELGCSIALVQQRLKSAGVKMRPSNARREIEIPEQDLRRMYWDEKLHPRQIGEKYGLTIMTIIKKMKKYGIPMRSKSEARLGDMNPIFGVGHSDEAREKMSSLFSEGRRQAVTGNRYGRRTEYAGVEFRSRWEAGVARYLDLHNTAWQYEVHSFRYELGGKKRTYVPDFYLPNQGKYIEVKGWFKEKDNDKIEAVRAQGIRIELWDRTRLLDLEIIDAAGKVLVGLDEMKKV